MKLVTCVCRDWNTHCIEVYELKLNFVYCSAEMNFMNFAMYSTDMGITIFLLFFFCLNFVSYAYCMVILFVPFVLPNLMFLACELNTISNRTTAALPISDNILQIVFVYVSLNGWLCNVVAINNYCLFFLCYCFVPTLQHNCGYFIFLDVTVFTIAIVFKMLYNASHTSCIVMLVVRVTICSFIFICRQTQLSALFSLYCVFS